MNVIVFMDSDLGSRSEGRSLRHKKRVVYAKMQKGESQLQEEVEKDDLVPSENQTISGNQLDIPLGASNVQTASGTASAVSGEDFLILTFSIWLVLSLCWPFWVCQMAFAAYSS